VSVPRPALDLFAPGSASVMVLFGARVGGVLLIAPIFSARNVSMMLRASLLVLLTVLLQPAALARVTTIPQITPTTALGETLIGFAIGLGAALFVGAAEATGEIVSIQMGLSGAALFDPLSQTQVTVLGQFAQLLAIALLLAADAHLVMLDSLAESLRLLPVGSAVDLRSGVGTMLSLGSTLFVLGLRFAAPVIAAVLVANVALAVLGRAAPQLNILSVAFPIQIGIGLFALAASVPLLAAFFGGWGSTYDAMLTHLFTAFRGTGGR
jgi:flagellar biosynthetic protein FliR